MSAPTYSPGNYVRAAWSVIRRDPFLVGFRIAADIGVGVAQFVAFFFVGLAVLLLVISGLGGPTVAHPLWLSLGAFGLWMTTAVASMAAQALVAGGIWSVATQACLGREIQPFRDFSRTVFAAFPTAFIQFAWLRLIDFFLFATLGTIAIASFTAARLLESGTGSDVVAPAIIWGLSLTCYSIFAILVRLTGEFVAPALFVEKMSFAAAITRAASTVLGSAVEIYRIFINAAVVLLIPLFIYWATIMVQNIALEVPGLEPVGAMVRLFGDVVLMVGMAAFFVVTQVSFFGFYVVKHGVRESLPDDDSLGIPESKGGFFSSSKPLRSPPTIENLLPSDTPNVFEMGEILGPVPDAPTPPADEPKEEQHPDGELTPDDEKETSLPAVEDFDLKALLKKSDDHDDDRDEPK